LNLKRNIFGSFFSLKGRLAQKKSRWLKKLPDVSMAAKGRLLSRIVGTSKVTARRKPRDVQHSIPKKQRIVDQRGRSRLPRAASYLQHGKHYTP
jgi:hypothetical protein